MKVLPAKTAIARLTLIVVDKYGIPVLRFHTQWSDYEIKQAKHMKETFKEILTNMGAVITWGDDDGEHNKWGLHNPG